MCTSQRRHAERLDGYAPASVSILETSYATLGFLRDQPEERSRMKVQLGYELFHSSTEDSELAECVCRTVTRQLICTLAGTADFVDSQRFSKGSTTESVLSED